jgi:hypothetical protein
VREGSAGAREGCALFSKACTNQQPI